MNQVPNALTQGEAAESGLNREHIRVLGLSTLGGILEYYEFIIFLFLLPILSKVMFPADVPAWLRQLQTLGIFAAGYLIRPLGGSILSMMGDRFGRKRIFGLTLLLMAAPTTCIGLLPTYAQAGVAAPLLLIFCRLCQGLAMGGEFPTAVTFIAEHVPTHRLGASLGILGGAFTLGSVLGMTVVMAVGQHFPHEQMLTHGWRIPFLLGGVFGFLSAYLRRYVKETPVFEEMRIRKRLSESRPFAQLFREFPAEILICFAASSAMAGMLSGGILFPLSYLQVELGFARDIVNEAHLWLTIGLLVGTLIGGVLLDVFGWIKVITVFAVGAAVALSLTFRVPDPATLRYGFVAIGFSAGFIAMLQNLLVCSFTAPVRVTGIALTYNVAQAVVGGLLPVTMGSLAHFDRFALIYVPGFFALVAVVITPIAYRYRKPIYSASIDAPVLR